ncbi:Amidohydrolase EgtC [Rubripirellula lacrimiformis]|uniref:Amidohydrolase EgtC n=1 Tax=Rubripirellula lacrimiformis TaxID=1930273 RepID=A0A517N4Q7_9BACT|nr:Amidohydrolase EgtC [Rubripirellula lacrimiformis]
MVHAQNALLIQSRSDEIGRSHSDGWGIGYYEDGLACVERSAAAAHHGLHFSNTAERVYSSTVISHVRLATVGTPAIENCHPFHWGNWVFAHNGTVQGIETLRPAMLGELSPTHRSAIQGSTDSELLFHWLMQRLTDSGVVSETICKSLDESASVIAENLSRLDSRCRSVMPEKPARLNTVLTDGHVMIASRLRNSLHWTHRDGVRDCEICGIPHVDHQIGFHYRAVVLASEPLSHEKWVPIPDGTVISIDDDIRTHSIPILGIEPIRSEAT